MSVGISLLSHKTGNSLQWAQSSLAEAAMECQTSVLEHACQPHAHAVVMEGAGGAGEVPAVAELTSCRQGELSLGAAVSREGGGVPMGGCRVVEVEMEVKASSHSSKEGGGSLASEAAAPGGDGANLPFSKELIRFSLYGRVPANLKHQLKESLSSRIAEVEQAFKNIPQMLYFSASSVAYDGIGVYAAESLPKDTLLGPYLGKMVRKEQVEADKNNQWLWEVYEEDSLSYFIDARDPKYGNWMNFIQCARNGLEQNLRMAQYNSNLYFVVTTDIQMGDELLVWYDQDQYSIYMGVPTGFRDIPPPPLFLEQQTTPQDSAGHTSPALPPPPLQDHIAPPTYSAYCAGRGSNFSDSASTDDSGLSMETSGGPTPPLPTTFDPTARHSSPHHREGSGLSVTEGACNSVYTSSQLLTGRLQGTASLPTGSAPLPAGSSEESFSTANLEGAEHLQQWYSISPLTSTLTSNTDKLTATPNTPSDHSPSDTPTPSWVGPLHAGAGPPPEGSTSWGVVGGGATTPTRSFVESPTGGGLAALQGGVAGKKQQLLYGLFSRSEDGSRWHCEECKRLFSSQGSLRAHARIHTGERPYQCQYCYRAFCQASTLRSHERLHTGEKPYKCEDCGRAFTQSAGLRSHRKTHRYDS